MVKEEQCFKVDVVRVVDGNGRSAFACAGGMGNEMDADRHASKK